MTVLRPLIEILAVIFCEEKFQVEKGLQLLCLCGALFPTFMGRKDVWERMRRISLRSRAGYYCCGVEFLEIALSRDGFIAKASIIDLYNIYFKYKFYL